MFDTYIRFFRHKIYIKLSSDLNLKPKKGLKIHKKQLNFCCKTCWKEQPFIFCKLDESPFSNDPTVWYVTMKCIKLNWLRKYMKKIRSSQVSISINSCTELSKRQFFPVKIVKMARVVDTKLIFRDWFFYNLIILIE